MSALCPNTVWDRKLPKVKAVLMCKYSSAWIILSSLWPLVLPASAYRKDLRLRKEPWGWLSLLDPRLIFAGVVWSVRQQNKVEQKSKWWLRLGGSGRHSGIPIGIHTYFFLLMISSGTGAWFLLRHLCEG